MLSVMAACAVVAAATVAATRMKAATAAERRPCGHATASVAGWMPVTGRYVIPARW